MSLWIGNEEFSSQSTYPFNHNSPQRVADEYDRPLHRIFEQPVRDHLRDQGVRVLEDAVGRGPSEQRGDGSIVAVGKDARVAHVFGEHLRVGEPEFSGFLRGPCFDGVAVEAVDGDDAALCQMGGGLGGRRRITGEVAYSTTGLGPL
jgi:hypothetical protein